MSMEILVDPEDRWLLERWSFKPRKAGKSSVYYAVAQTSFGMRKMMLYLHHFIVGHPLPGWSPDHINRNGLDNRRSNLRIVPVSENMKNRRSWTETGVRHVHRHNRTRFCANVTRNRKRIVIGYYATIEEAIAGRDAWFAANEPEHLSHVGDEGEGK